VCSAVVGVLGLADTLTSRPVYHELSAALFDGKLNPEWLRTEHFERNGIYRASSVFEHPILLGVAMAFALILAQTLPWGTRLLISVGCATGLIASISSAPLLAALMGFALMGYSKFFRHRRRWTIIILAIGSPLLMFLLVHPNPFSFLSGHLLLDPTSGYYRLLIWQYAGPHVLDNPLFGIGALGNWVRPSWMNASIDSFWLVLALNYGIPGSVLIALSLASAFWLPVRCQDVNDTVIGIREERMAEAIGIVVFITFYVGFTVHIWGICWMLLSLLAGLRANLGNLAALSQRRPQERSFDQQSAAF
jgi:hypothetical protein